jgi:hypothetical protein
MYQVYKMLNTPQIKLHHPIEKPDNPHKEICMKINLIQNSAERLQEKCMSMKLLM